MRKMNWVYSLYRIPWMCVWESHTRWHLGLRHKLIIQFTQPERILKFVPSLNRVAPSNWVTDSCLPLGWHVRIKVVNVSSGTYWGRENQEKDGQIKKIHKWFAAQIWPILIRIGINDRTLRNGENIYWFYGVFWHLNQYGVGSRICKIYLRGKLWQCGGKFSEIIQIG